MFLSPDELTELTDYKHPAKQIRWLCEHGYRFDVGASGRPKVLRSEIERRLGRTEKTTGKPPRLELLKKTE